MTSRLKRGAIPLVLAAGSLVLALAQDPGAASSDTKIDLHVDPSRFLGEVAAPWNDSLGLGGVWSGQYSGYLWPMGPFFALGNLAGLPAWLIQRLWLAALLALAAWGTVRLVDELYSSHRGVAHLMAGATVVLNPYVVVFANRTSITLLAYAALPWLLIATRRGLRSPAGLWWPAAFALLVASAGGGINAASLAWVLVGPALLVLYELVVLRTSPAAVRAFVVRAIPLTLLASLWWVVATGVHASYGFDFLRFTEQPSAIWHTTSLTESLRGLGFWLTYTELDFDRTAVPAFSNVGPLFFDRPVVVASLLLPALGVTGFLLARRRPYAPFLLGMVIAGGLIMAAGYPEGAPLRRALTSLYEGVQPTQFLRTTYKAGPLVMIGLAVLAGLAADAAWRRAPRVAPRTIGAAAAAAVLALAAWPLVSGDAVDEKIQFDYPRSWERTAADLDRSLPEGTRSLTLPGSLFGFHRWGGVTDPALAPLTEGPSAARFVVPFSDPRATDLLWTLDSLVQEGRAFPGQLRPLVELMGVGAVVAPFDYDPRRSGSVPPADAARALANGGLAHTRDYGTVQGRPGSSFTLDGALPLPELRRFDTRGSGPVRVHRRDPATVVDGGAGGVAALAAFGALPRDRALLYAADQSPGELRRLARRDAHFVISDSNRRRAFQNTRLRASPGRALDPGDAVAGDATVIEPFGDGPDSQTTATYAGARWLRGNADVNFNPFPERRPALAFDGDERTAWIASGFLRAGESPFLDVGFSRRRDVREVELLPYGDARGRPLEVRIAGRTHPLRRGWNRLRLNLRGVNSLRVEISRTQAPARGGGPGGVRELRIPGFRPRERLRMPTLSARALRGEALRSSQLTVLAERATAYLPWRVGRAGGALQALDARDRADSEERIERVVELPAAKLFRADAWVSPGVATPDAVLERMAGVAAGVSASEPYDGVPGRRAWRAFDGDRATGWIGAWRGGRAWVQWTTDETARLSSLRLIPPRERVRTPSRVRLVHDGRRTPAVEVGAGGLVELPRAITGRRFRLEILATSGAPEERAVGIAELRGRGLPRVRAPRPGAPIRGRCGDAAMRVGDRRVPLRPQGTFGRLASGGPLRALGCRPLALAAGRHVLVTSRGPLRTDLLRLQSPRSPQPVAASGGRVVDPGKAREGSVEGARLALDGPAWLVLLQSYNRGWRAKCDGRDLGEPEPVDGFANGWKVDRCRSASFSFGPGGPVVVSYVISAIAALALIALLLLRRPGAPAPEPRGLPDAETAPRRRPLGTALAIGVAASVLLGFVFAWRAGPVLGPLVALVLWRGIGARELAAASAALLGLVVPAIYLIKLPEDLGGFNSSYANDLLSAHWVAVGAVACAGLAAWRAAAELSRARSDPAAGGAPPPA